ncbi:MAG: substrate-binding domain-containing protein, partial [Burkholderiales bacterium]
MKLKTIFTSSIVVASMAFTGIASAVDVTGAGATFPFPIYSKWAEDYKKVSNFNMNYQSIGSGAGVRQIQAKTVDFGATDAPLSGEQLAKDGLIQFPAIIGGVVMVVNLDGV